MYTPGKPYHIGIEDTTRNATRLLWESPQNIYIWKPPCYRNMDPNVDTNKFWASDGTEETSSGPASHYKSTSLFSRKHKEFTHQTLEGRKVKEVAIPQHCLRYFSFQSPSIKTRWAAAPRWCCLQRLPIRPLTDHLFRWPSEGFAGTASTHDAHHPSNE